MGAKNRWTVDFKCDGCGQDGVIQFSENDYPYTPPERAVKIKEGSFSVSMKDLLKASAVCQNCRTVTLI